MIDHNTASVNEALQEVRDQLLAKGLKPKRNGSKIVVKKKKACKITISVIHREPVHFGVMVWVRTKRGGYALAEENKFGISTRFNFVNDLIEFVSDTLANSPVVAKTESRPTDDREELLPNIIGREIKEKIGARINILAGKSRRGWNNPRCDMTTREMSIEIADNYVNLFGKVGWDNVHKKVTFDPASPEFDIDQLITEIVELEHELRSLRRRIFSVWDKHFPRS